MTRPERRKGWGLAAVGGSVKAFSGLSLVVLVDGGTSLSDSISGTVEDLSIGTCDDRRCLRLRVNLLPDDISTL